MPGKKSVVVTFRVDAHLAEELDRLPDRSAFIREAIQQRLHDTCPACGGEGRVDCGSGTWIRQTLEKAGGRVCTCCTTTFLPRGDSTTCGHCGSDGHRH